MLKYPYLILLLVISSSLAQQAPPPTTQPIRPIGGSLFLAPNLPPFTSGNTSQHIVWSGFGDTAAYNTQTGHAFKILADLESRCEGDNPPHAFPRVYHTRNNEYIYYCFVERTIYFIRSDKTIANSIALEDSYAFYRSKWVWNNMFFGLVGNVKNSDGTRESYLILIHEQKQAIASISKLEGGKKEPIIDWIYLSMSEAIGVGEESLGNGLTKLNFYKGRDTRFSEEEHIGSVESKEGFINRFDVTDDKTHFVYTGISPEGEGLAGILNIETKANFIVPNVYVIRNKHLKEEEEINWSEVYFAVSPRLKRIAFLNKAELDVYAFSEEDGSINRWKSKKLNLKSEDYTSFRGYLQIRKTNDEIWFQFDTIMMSVVFDKEDMTIESVTPDMNSILGLHTFYGQTVAISSHGIFISNSSKTIFSYYLDIYSYFRDDAEESVFHIFLENCTFYSIDLKKSMLIPTLLQLPLCHERMNVVGDGAEGKINFAVINKETNDVYLYCNGEQIFRKDFSEVQEMMDSIQSKKGSMQLFYSCAEENPKVTIAGNTCDDENLACTPIWKVDIDKEGNLNKDTYTLIGARMTRLSRDTFMINAYDLFFGDFFLPMHAIQKSPAAHFMDEKVWGFFRNSLGFHMQKDYKHKVYVYVNFEGLLYSLVRTQKGNIETAIAKQAPRGSEVTLQMGSYRENTFITTQKTDYAKAVYVYLVIPPQYIEP